MEEANSQHTAVIETGNATHERGPKRRSANRTSRAEYGMRTLVTGGAGFLGSHLCERLLEKGHDVLCVDNYYTGRKRNVSHLVDNPHFELMRHDITFPLFVEVDQIFNLACPASPNHYQRHPIQTIKTSVMGALNVLGLAKRLSIRVLQASTSEVYGDSAIHPQTEDYKGNVNPIGPRACYDEGKRCAETLFFDYWRRHDLKIKVARIFNTYGPRMHPNDGRVISNFVVSALEGNPIRIYGDGTQTRSFCYVDDLIDGLERFIDSHPDTIGPINFGNPEEYTIVELAKQILELTGSRSRIEYRALPEDDPKRRRPNIARAEAELGWKPRTALKKGLVSTIEYFDSVLSRQGLTDRVSVGDSVAMNPEIASFGAQT